MFGEADIMFEAASSLHEKMCEYFLLKEQCHEIKKLFGISLIILIIRQYLGTILIILRIIFLFKFKDNSFKVSLNEINKFFKLKK